MKPLWEAVPACSRVVNKPRFQQRVCSKLLWARSINNMVPDLAPSERSRLCASALLSWSQPRQWNGFEWIMKFTAPMCLAKSLQPCL